MDVTDIAKKETLEELLEKVLLEAKNISNCDGCTLYVLGEDERLHFSIVINDSLNIHMGGSSINEVSFKPLEIYNSLGELNTANVCSFAFANKKTINIQDIRKEENFNFAGTLAFDEENNYITYSMLTVPLKNTRGEAIAVMQLINAKDDKENVIEFSPEVQNSIDIMSMQASLLVENNRLLLEHRKVLESLIELIAHAIDTKSPYTGAHCQRVPVITKMLATAVSFATKGPFKDFEMTEDNWYALHLASWLHDCGKVTTPEYVMDKATKLETIHNRIHEIRTRFEILRRDAYIKYLEDSKTEPDKENEYKELYEKTVQNLNDEFTFLARCNIGNVALTEAGIAKINEIGERSYVRNFDRTLGLSRAELERVNQEEDSQVPAIEKLLEDREDFVFGGYNRGEKYNLGIKVGTLSSEERNKINDHAKITLEMLQAIPFPEHYQEVVEYAASHHERMDGNGYPLGLTGKQMSVPARIIAIADVFEALSSTDRPYKKVKKLSDIINIMYNMSKSGHIDPDIFQIFLTSNVYKEYAEEYMLPEQCDDFDISLYIDEK